MATGRGGPLAGVRVVELAGIGPAPFAAMLLADLGADVIRVERPGSSGANDLLNRGKRALAVDLKHDRGPATVLALAEQAEILLEGFRPGVTERLGVGPEDCWAVNPKLVYGRMTGWGQQGPLAPRAGHDIAYISLTGMLHAIGRAGGPPQVPANLLGDFGGGAMYLVVGVLAALLEARGSGQGQVVDASIVDGATHLGSMLFGLMGNLAMAATLFCATILFAVLTPGSIDSDDMGLRLGGLLLFGSAVGVIAAFGSRRHAARMTTRLF